MLAICFRLLLLSVLFGYLLLFPVAADAFNPRFEIDPALFQWPTASFTTHNNNHHTSQKRKSVRKRRGVPSVHVISAKRQEPASRLFISASANVVSEQEMTRIRMFWSVLTATDQSISTSLAYRTPAFSLAIDPKRYPLLVAADGSKVLLDTAVSLPPLVRTLLQEQDPDLRIISVSPRDSRHFLGDLLRAGGFFSVEEQPQLVFGTDPQLRVNCDFKVERTAASVLQHEVALVNSAVQGMPASLSDYLKTQGLILVEPFADPPADPLPSRHRIIPVKARDQQVIVDTLLDALAIPVIKRQQVELYSPLESGIGLSVTAERSFEFAGKRYVVAYFNGDPVAYTLIRLLETKGYRVVMLNPGDSFKVIADKLLSRISLPTRHAVHTLISDPFGKYMLTTSGVLLENAHSGGGAVLLTDAVPAHNLHRLLSDHGYQVQE